VKRSFPWGSMFKPPPFFFPRTGPRERVADEEHSRTLPVSLFVAHYPLSPAGLFLLVIPLYATTSQSAECSRALFSWSRVTRCPPGYREHIAFVERPLNSSLSDVLPALDTACAFPCVLFLRAFIWAGYAVDDTATRRHCIRRR